MLKSVLKEMILHNTENYNSVYLKQMKKLINTWEIVTIKVTKKPMTNKLTNFIKEI